MTPVNLDALLPVAEAFRALGIEYYIGGSLASSVHGRARSTADVHLAANVKVDHIPALVARLESDYYIDAHMIRKAIYSGQSFNLIHLPTAYKVDVFPMGARPFEQSARRRVVQSLLPPLENLLFPVASAEDTILYKLEWYRMAFRVDIGSAEVYRWF